MTTKLSKSIKNAETMNWFRVKSNYLKPDLPMLIFSSSMSTSSGDDGLRLKKSSPIERLDKTSQLTLQQELLVTTTEHTIG